MRKAPAGGRGGRRGRERSRRRDRPRSRAPAAVPGLGRQVHREGGEGERQNEGGVVGGERANAQPLERRRERREPHEVLGERQHARDGVEEGPIPPFSAERNGVSVPPQEPRVEEWVHEVVWHSVREARREREGHQDRPGAHTGGRHQQSSRRRRTGGRAWRGGRRRWSSGTGRSLTVRRLVESARRGPGRPVDDGRATGERDRNEAASILGVASALASTFVAASLALPVWAIVVAVDGRLLSEPRPPAPVVHRVLPPLLAGVLACIGAPALAGPHARRSGAGCARRCTPSRRRWPLS